MHFRPPVASRFVALRDRTRYRTKPSYNTVELNLCLALRPFPNDKFGTLPNWKSLQTTILNFMKMSESSLKWLKTLWEKEKLLVTSNFSFSHSVFQRLLLQTRKTQGLFGKRLRYPATGLETKTGRFTCPMLILLCNTYWAITYRMIRVACTSEVHGGYSALTSAMII